MAVGASVDAEVTAGNATASGPGAPATGSSHRRLTLLVLAGLVAVAVAVAVSLRPSGLPEAALVGHVGARLPAAPAGPVVPRWTRDLRDDAAVALVDDRVVVMEADARPPATDATITAFHVRSRAVLWEQRLDRSSLVVLVEDDGATTTMHGPWSPTGHESEQSLVALANDDGRTLWERPVSFDLGSASGHVLLATAEGCELVDTRTGRTTWRAPTQGCQWLDDDEVMVSRRGGWEFHGLDGTETRPHLPGLAAPAAVGENLVRMDGEDLVLIDRAGEEQWRRPADLDQADGSVWLRSIPDVGIVATGWDEESGGEVTRAFDLQGESLDDMVDWVTNVDILRVDDRVLVVDMSMVDPEDGTVAHTVRAADEPDRPLGSVETHPANRQWTITTRGALAPSPSGDQLVLHAWPAFEPAWQVDLPDIVTTGETWQEVLSSEHGLVVIGPNHRRLHAFG